MVSLAKTTPEIDAYYKECVDLVKTLTIKHSISADLLNAHVKRTYPNLEINYNDPKTWKYYLNISGEYHSTDTIMKVTSLDTLEEIDFTKQNLKSHTATRQAYLFGTRYYYSLVNQYKKQEQLILGILYPADIDEAINADDGSILAYPEYLVQPQEQTLIFELETFIKHNMSKHFCYGYSVTDKYYASIYFVCLIMLLYVEVINCRLTKIKTYQAHDFHIRMYLGSFFGLDKYLKYLNKKQVFWLYKNVIYLERNAGTAESFQSLIENLMAERSMPVAEYSLRSLMEFDDDLRPIIRARKRPIESGTNNSEVTYISLDKFLTLTAGDKSGNPQYLSDEQERITQQIQNSNTSIIQTKVIESDVVDYSNAVPVPLADVIFSQWFYMANNNLLNTVVSFEDAVDGTNKTLNALDAFIYYCYLFAKQYTELSEFIPEFILSQARVKNKPNLEGLLEFFPNEHRQQITPELIKLIERSPDIKRCVNAQDFLNTCLEIYDEKIYEWYLLSNTHDAMIRGCLELAIKEFYKDACLSWVPSTGVTWKSWLASKNITAYELTELQTQQTLDQIFKSISSYDIDESLSVKNIQKALIEILKNFISYTVQVIGTVNSSDVILMHGPHLRLTNFKTSGGYTETVFEGLYINAIDSLSKYSTAVVDTTPIFSMGHKGSDSLEFKTPSLVLSMTQESQGTITILENPMEFSISYDGMDEDYCAEHGMYFAEFLKTINASELDRLIRATS